MQVYNNFQKLASPGLQDLETEETILIPLLRMVKQIHIPFYLEVYISSALQRGKILDPYATISLLTSRKSSIPLGDNESKANLSDLFSTNSAINFNNGVVTYTVVFCQNYFEQIKDSSISSTLINIHLMR